MLPYSLPFTADQEGCSRAGAEYALPKAGTQLAIVYALIQAEGPLSDRQISARTGFALSVICARRNELVKRGLVESAGTAMGAFNVQNTRWIVARNIGEDRADSPMRIEAKGV